MHPDVEPYAKDVAEKQKTFWEAWKQLEESNANFLQANVESLSYYAISEAHRRIFDKWIEASRALGDAVKTMHENALKAAGIPKE